ncbi:UDP-glucose 4-epimerase GalE [Paracrocinitomix mangrovi]|uniref:UDP-glucose 4-epimerase GalE n=1 Tax=Paracrocinitomix mangrovi TaxID=2862509 RepID=UPI001C8DB61C|nr:UDP-glucose 4-epimerase GalE [Paracrocinitomix mangrovi]UKN00135.1 UDP-glucose 4-epimerase GalE [Paracrocinitomix mangrovi]
MSANNQIVVTGGAGYIGSHTVVELVNAGYEPIIIDDFRNSKEWIIDRLNDITNQSLKVYTVDCTSQTDIDKVFADNKGIVGVIHFAAYKAVGESVAEPVMYYENNITSMCVVLNAMKKFNVEQLVFSSSCTVYGEPDNPIVDEHTPIQKAESPYGATKIACEQLAQFAVQSGQALKICLLRYFNPIGAHPSGKIGELPQGIPNNLVPYITQTVKGIREKLTVFGDDYNTADGTCIRDYIHVVDLADAHVKALNWLAKQSSSVCEPFNLGTGKGSSVLEIIHTFENVNQVKVNYQIGDRRPGDVEQIWANAAKANNVLNWHCKYTMADALKHSWNWEQNIEA